ncbi:MAG: Ig-like domain-containing protein [Muribaculaceae bacterium]|nr:Ig-like domain-containing protein [Muribaculaceae bacterium]
MKKIDKNKINRSGSSKGRQERLDDTLEFLDLSDEVIEEYNHKTSFSYRERKEDLEELEDEEYDEEEYEDDEYDDEEYEDDEYDEDEEYEDEYDDEEEYEEDEYDEDEEYEEDEYDEDEEYEEDEYDEDEEYEDDEYEDEEEYEYDKYASDNIFARIGNFIADMSALDRAVALFGCFILIAAVITGVLYFGSKSESKQLEAFAEVGTEIENIGVIGESGLLAVSNAEAARLSHMMDTEQEEPEDKPEEVVEDTSIEVGMNITSILSDMKIKFVNVKTGKLIGGVPFEVEVNGSGNKTFHLIDEDKDGIIYQTDVDADTYTVKVVALQGEEYRKYQLPTQGNTVKVTDKIAYKKVDVADEIKSEAEVNAAAEDTAKPVETESALTDTVEWVESTKTEIESEENYKEMNKADIPDPSTIGKLSGFRKLVATVTSETGSAEVEEMTDKERNEKRLEALNPVLEPSSVEIDMSKAASVSLSVSVSSGLSYQISWESSNTSVASVSSGVVTAVGSGNATITATITVGENPESAASKQITCAVHVTGGGAAAPAEPDNPADPEKPKDPTDPAKPTNPDQEYRIKSIEGGGTIQVGKSCNVKGTTEPEGGVITWTSSDTNIAVVDAKGIVTGLSVGTALIRGTSNSGDYKECSVTVVEKEVTYKSLTITGSATIQVGKTGSVKGTTDPAGGIVTWTSSDEKIVKIDGSGNMTGVSVGTATITGVCANVQNTWKVTVTKEKDVSSDNKTKLKDKSGNQVYVKNSDGKFVEATYADYYKSQKFYLKSKTAKYRYTGWQTIDGYTYFYDKNGNYVTGEQVIQGARYTFGSDGRLSSGSGSLGIDVSKWNGSIDWNAVRNSGISYVIIRCGYRGSSTGALIEDPKFASNIKGARAAGLKVGVYFFSQAVNEVEAVEEASMALNLVKGYGLNYPIFLDVEDSGGRGDKIDTATRTAVCKAFCATVQNSGYAAGIYANKTWLTSRINTGSLTGYKIWLAQYAATPSYTATRYDMWQYSSKGKVGGISGNVDMNISYMNY